MDPSAGAGLRWVRACLLAFVTVGLGVASHRSAGGALPGLPALVVLSAGCATVSASQLGRPASVARVTGLLVAGQVAVHTWLTAAAHLGATDPGGTSALGGTGGGTGMNGMDMAGMTGHHHAAMTAAGTGVSTGAAGTHMTLAHLLAVAGVGLWLVVGERALWRVLGFTVGGVRDLRHRLAPPGPLPVDRSAPGLPGGPAVVTARTAHLVAHQTALRRSLARRGPPPLALTA